MKCDVLAAPTPSQMKHFIINEFFFSFNLFLASLNIGGQMKHEIWNTLWILPGGWFDGLVITEYTVRSRSTCSHS